MYYMVLFLLLIIGVIVLFKVLKHYNYELFFKESIFYNLLQLIITFYLLSSLINKSFTMIFSIYFYFFILLLIYYVARYIKLKKYIPIKIIVGYILIDIIILLIIFYIEYSVEYIDKLAYIVLFYINILFFAIYIAMLIFINIIILIIKTIKKDNKNYKNNNYKMSRLCFINILVFMTLVGLIIGINYYIIQYNNQLVEKSREKVIEYIEESYPNYDFRIVSVSEIDDDCWMFGCKTHAFQYEVTSKELEISFNIYVRKDDLSIYKDEFEYYQ